MVVVLVVIVVIVVIVVVVVSSLQTGLKSAMTPIVSNIIDLYTKIKQNGIKN